MRTIPLTKGQVALVDEGDYESLIQYKWYAKWDKDTESFYVFCNMRDAHGKRYLQSLHRQLFGLLPGDLRQLDHLNHDTLDNRRDNLVLGTAQTNQRNTRIRSDNSSGYKGVTWDSQRGLWRAFISIEKTQVKLGRYITLAEAVIARKEAERRYWK